MAAYRRQYVDPLDFRRQCGGSDGAVAVYALLSDLRDRSGNDAYPYPAGCDGTDCGRLRRDRGRVRRVFITIPDRTTGGDVSRAVCAILLGAAGNIVFGDVVFAAVVQRDTCVGQSRPRRRHRVVGACRWLYGWATALSVVPVGASSASAAPTRWVWRRVGMAAATPLVTRKEDYG